MDGFKVRLIQEDEDLTDKLYKLVKFIESDGFQSIDDVQAMLLEIQADAMQTYLRCLAARLDLLTKMENE